MEVYVVRPPKPRYALHAMLFLATIFTTLVVGARMEFNFLHNLPVFSLNDDALPLFPVRWALAQPSRLLLGSPFASTLMLIRDAWCVYPDSFAHPLPHGVIRYWHCRSNCRISSCAGGARFCDAAFEGDYNTVGEFGYSTWISSGFSGDLGNYSNNNSSQLAGAA